MRKRESDRIEKLWKNKENENDLLKAIGAAKKFGCKIIGTNENCDNCANCSGVLKEICDYQKTQIPVKKSRSQRPWREVIVFLTREENRKEIINYCVKSGLSESAAKDFVYSSGCIVNAIMGKGKKGGMVVSYIDYLRKGKKGTEPKGSKNLMYYCNKVWSVYSDLKNDPDALKAYDF